MISTPVWVVWCSFERNLSTYQHNGTHCSRGIIEFFSSHCGFRSGTWQQLDRQWRSTWRTCWTRVTHDEFHSVHLEIEKGRERGFFKDTWGRIRVKSAFAVCVFLGALTALSLAQYYGPTRFLFHWNTHHMQSSYGHDISIDFHQWYWRS